MVVLGPSRGRCPQTQGRRLPEEEVRRSSTAGVRRRIQRDGESLPSMKNIGRDLHKRWRIIRKKWVPRGKRRVYGDGGKLVKGYYLVETILAITAKRKTDMEPSMMWDTSNERKDTHALYQPCRLIRDLILVFLHSNKEPRVKDRLFRTGFMNRTNSQVKRINTSP